MSDQERISRLEFALGTLIGWLYPDSLGASELKHLYGMLHRGYGVPSEFTASTSVPPEILPDRIRKWDIK